MGEASVVAVGWGLLSLAPVTGGFMSFGRAGLTDSAAVALVLGWIFETSIAVIEV